MALVRSPGRLHGAVKSGRRAVWLGSVVALLVLCGAAVGLWPRAGQKAAAAQATYQTASIDRGDLDAAIMVTGNLRGHDAVVLGAQVSGTISAVHVDFNDVVKEGQVLCEIDSKELAASLRHAKTQLAAARAAYADAKAIAKEAALTVRHKRALMKTRLVARQDLEAALAAKDRAQESARSARAQIALEIAAVDLARTKLRKTKIRAPMDGIVLTRHVEVGRTVAPSEQEAMLFTVARSLRQLELALGIDEADVGQIDEGMRATFTVDAFPDREFVAQLRGVHKIGIERDDVVTYEALFTVANDDMALRPGMTAAVAIMTGVRRDVLRVPNAALRFELGKVCPPAAPHARTTRPRRSVWVLREGRPTHVPVEVRRSNGQFSELVEGPLEVGAKVIIGMDQRDEDGPGDSPPLASDKDSSSK